MLEDFVSKSRCCMRGKCRGEDGSVEYIDMYHLCVCEVINSAYMLFPRANLEVKKLGLPCPLYPHEECQYLPQYLPVWLEVDKYDVGRNLRHFSGTDIAKITRKEPKLNKNEHENGKSTQEPRCMRTRNSYFANNSSVIIPRRQNKRRTPNVVEPELRTIVEVTPMADTRTMKELLQTHRREMLRACPHHGFTELAHIDTFYNGLIENDQDSLNVAAGGNLLSKTTREALQIIKNKSKVHYSRNKPNVSTMNTTSRENASKTDVRIDKLADQISTLVDIVSKKVVTLAMVKAVEESCVTCGSNHAYYNCDASNSNQSSVCAETSTYNQVAHQNHAGNYMAPPGFAPVQNNNQNRFNQNQGQGNIFNRGNNFHGTFDPTPKKVVEQETEETTDKKQTNFQGSTAYIQPPVVPIPEPDVLKTLPKPNIPYPSRLNDQKLCENAMNQMEKFFQIFQDFHFEISFADALLLMPKFASTIKSLLAK
nr:reverse transcriptase domain-containing protein [Tanacetum cinerariifolium]